MPWNNIPWSISTENGSDGLPGKDSENGAVKVARSMYTKSSTCGVTSTLCYGVQWDAVMQYIEPQYKNVPAEGQTEPVPADSFVRNSSNKGNYDETGNYEGNLAVTGSNPAYQTNHIYDLAGNVDEWTMEAYHTDHRVLRSGYFNNTGSDIPASYRGWSTPSYAGSGNFGFRQALYV